MEIYVGSARHDENGAYSGGNAGDSLQKNNSFDTVGEVSMQKFYVHKRGWIILRAKSNTHAVAIAEAMKLACNNHNLGYNQNERLGVIRYGIKTTTPTECDCSSLVRACIKYATGTDVGNFTTVNEVQHIMASGLFVNKGAYTDQQNTPLYLGDILVTRTKGHTVIVVQAPTSTSTKAEAYNQAQFIQDVEQILSATTVSGALNKVVPISITENRTHALVTPLERYMKVLGFYSGSIEADNGKTPYFGGGMEKAIKQFQEKYVKGITAKELGTVNKSTWSKLLSQL